MSAVSAGRAVIAPGSGSSSGSRPPSLNRQPGGHGGAQEREPSPAVRRDSLEDLVNASGGQLGRSSRGPPVPAARSRSSGGRDSELPNGGLDFDEEARKLWARLNLDPSVINQGLYNALDPLWRHPTSGGIFYVGNQTAAANLELLRKFRVTHVVNCTDSMPCYHDRKGGGPIKYFRFDITSHYRRVRTDEHAVHFAQPMLDWVSAALEEGSNVMAHCLAGAHRAGTTGCICLMHFANLTAREAVPVAKRCRPIIDPIGDFPELMAKLERGWTARKAA